MVSEGSLEDEWYYATATPLPDGRVFIAGGYNDSLHPTDQTWIYLPPDGAKTKQGRVNALREEESACEHHIRSVLPSRPAVNLKQHRKLGDKSSRENPQHESIGYAFQPFGQKLKAFRAHIEHYSSFLAMRTLHNSIQSEYPNCSFILSMPLACLLESMTCVYATPTSSASRTTACVFGS